MEKLTYEQEKFICVIIGEWYLKWKNQLIDLETRTHRLGVAKEDLKKMICKPNYERLEEVSKVIEEIEEYIDNK